MKSLLLIHGPNLNTLGDRNTDMYGTLTLDQLEHEIKEYAALKNFEVICFQSNHEGALIDIIQTAEADAIIINPGALAHYSYALHDALIDKNLPAIEVHLSNIKERESWRAQSVIEPACIKMIVGKKLAGYLEAVDYLAEHFSDES